MSEAQNGGNMMKRLTNKAWRNFDPWECCGQDKYCQRGCHDPGGCTKGCIVPQLYARLGAYEDTGLDPAMCANYKTFEDEAISKGVTFKRIVALMEADNDGRLVVLPAKTVFELTWDAGPDCDLICPVSVDGESCCSFCDKGELCIYERKCRQEHIEQIGKTVFLTREAAEKALEAMKDD